MMTKKEKLADFVVSLLMLFPAMLWSAFVLSTLWGWFVVPLGVVPIGISWAYGLTVLVYVVWTPRADEPDGKSVLLKLVWRAVELAAALPARHIAHSMMGG